VLRSVGGQGARLASERLRTFTVREGTGEKVIYYFELTLTGRGQKEEDRCESPSLTLERQRGIVSCQFKILN